MFSYRKRHRAGDYVIGALVGAVLAGAFGCWDYLRTFPNENLNRAVGPLGYGWDYLKVTAIYSGIAGFFAGAIFVFFLRLVLRYRHQPDTGGEYLSNDRS